MATCLEDIRTQLDTLNSELRSEIKNSGEPCQPNVFITLAPDGVRIYSEHEGTEVEGITIPDGALGSLKTRLTYLLGTA